MNYLSSSYYYYYYYFVVVVVVYFFIASSNRISKIGSCSSSKKINMTGQVRSEYPLVPLSGTGKKGGEGVRGDHLHWRVQGITSSPTGIGSRRRVV